MPQLSPTLNAGGRQRTYLNIGKFIMSMSEYVLGWYPRPMVSKWIQ
ncbi:MAG: hypothetical protein ACXAC7_22440 [Candidatus Hodarchaeales archaeon]